MDNKLRTFSAFSTEGCLYNDCNPKTTPPFNLHVELSYENIDVSYADADDSNTGV